MAADRPQDGLARVAALYATREQAAARALQAARARERRAHDQADELQRHQGEYLTELAATGRDGIDVARLRSYRHFIARLDDLRRDQQRQAVLEAARVEQRLDDWITTRRLHKGVEAIRTQRADAARTADERLRQRALDDLASTRAAGMALERPAPSTH
jgi:flagellar export protein FliJ